MVLDYYCNFIIIIMLVFELFKSISLCMNGVMEAMVNDPIASGMRQ